MNKITDECSVEGEEWSYDPQCETLCSGEIVCPEVPVNEDYCYCTKEGYVRNENNECVPVEKCGKSFNFMTNFSRK